VAQAIGSITQAEPTLGAIVQGAFSGQVKDVRGALKTLSEQSAAARDAAIAKVEGVSTSAWAFPNARRDQDFTAADYAR
jgi:multiple sugar transport system substrate-binding protein